MKGSDSNRYRIMMEAFLTLETIPEQLVQDGERTIYEVKEMGRVRFQLEFG